MSFDNIYTVYFFNSLMTSLKNRCYFGKSFCVIKFYFLKLFFCQIAVS